MGSADYVWLGEILSIGDLEMADTEIEIGAGLLDIFDAIEKCEYCQHEVEESCGHSKCPNCGNCRSCGD